MEKRGLNKKLHGLNHTNLLNRLPQKGYYQQKHCYFLESEISYLSSHVSHFRIRTNVLYGGVLRCMKICQEDPLCV